MTIEFAPLAVEDLAGAIAYIHEKNPSAAERLERRVFDTIDTLAAGDFEGPSQQLSTGETVRSWPVPPLRIYYRRTNDELTILRIYHQRREPIAR